VTTATVCYRMALRHCMWRARRIALQLLNCYSSTALPLRLRLRFLASSFVFLWLLLMLIVVSFTTTSPH